MNMRQVDRVTRSYKVLKVIIIAVVATVPLWKGNRAEHDGTRECHNIKEYREVFGVSVAGQYASTQ